MKRKSYIILSLFFFIVGCISQKSSFDKTESNVQFKNDTIKITDKPVKTINDTVRIANDSLEYEVIIIDPGFSFWLASRAFPRWYHSQSYLENKNIFYVNEWNNRVLQPQRFNTNLYEMTINYESHINYGYEVNYLIYNYFIFFQNTYNQRLFGNVPPR